MLNYIYQEMKFELVEISGGKKENAIPNEACAALCIDPARREDFLTAAPWFR